MKKFLLFALVALVSLTAGAQTAGRKSLSAKMAQERQVPVREIVNKMLPAANPMKVHGQKRIMGHQQATTNLLLQQLNPVRPVLGQPMQFTRQMLRSMKPLRQVRKAEEASAAEVKELYHAKGSDYYYDEGKEHITPVKWDMYSGKVVFEDESEGYVFLDVVPTPESFKAVEGYENGVYYEYTVEGNTVTVPAQTFLTMTGSDETIYYIGLFAMNPNAQTRDEIVLGDGSVKFTLGEDGSLELQGTTTLIIGIFTDKEISNATYYSYYQWTDEVTYRYEGQTEPMPEGVTATAEFDAYAYDYNSKADVTWSLWKGEKVEGIMKSNVLVNVVPTPSNLKADNPNGIAVPYTQLGNSITIKPTKVGVLKGRDPQTGKPYAYYLYLFGLNENDGSISISVGEDGSLNTIDGQAIVIGAFSKDEYVNPNSSDTWVGQLAYYQDVKYLLPGTIPAPKPEYEPLGIYLNGEITPSLMGYNATFTNIPAYAPLSFTNFTSEASADAYSWKMNVLGVENQQLVTKEVLTGTDRDFSITTLEEGTYYNAPDLIAANQGVESSPYNWGTAHSDEDDYAQYFSTGLLGMNETIEDEPMILTKASINNNSIYIEKGYGTPDVNSDGDEITRLIFYQGKPDAPLYFEGVNLMVHDLKNYDNLTLKCQIVKCSRSEEGYLELGDVIAEGITAKENVVEGYQDGGWLVSQLNWENFYTRDEEGLTQALEFMQVEDEFAIVIDGWNNGTFSCIPFFEYYCNSDGITNTYCNITGNENYPEDALLSIPSDYTHAYVGFINPIYGYLYTEDDTNITLPAEGGTAKLRVIPMLYTTDEETGQPATAIWDEEEMDEEYEFPEWIEWDTENDTYSSAGVYFDLVIKAEPMPAGVASRTETINFYQWGAKLTVTVTQSDPTGIAEVSTAAKNTKGHIYTLSGQRVNKAQKGVYIVGNKKLVVK